jgi:hypothetical protein
MAYNNILGEAETYVAGADLTGKQYTFVTSDGDEVTTTGAGASATGVLWNEPTLADAATVVRGGEVNVYVGTGGLTVGANVASDAAGLAVVAGTGDEILGVARTAAAAGGLATVTFYKVAQSTSA